MFTPAPFSPLARVHVFVLGGRPLAMRSADLVVQIGRAALIGVSASTDPSAGVSQASGFCVNPLSSSSAAFTARAAAGGRAEHHGDQLLAVARGGGDQIESGCADEAGLHAVGAGIAAEQRVVVADHPSAEFDRRDVPIEIVFGEIADQRARQDGEIARRGDLAVGRQAVGIDEVRFASCPDDAPCSFMSSAKFSIEPSTPSASSTAMSLADFTIIILSALSTVTWVPTGKPILVGDCASALRETVNNVSKRDAILLDRLQRDVSGHQLGHRGRVPGIGRVLGAQHLAGIGFDQNRALPALSRRCGQGWRRTRNRGRCRASAPEETANDTRVAVRSVGRAQGVALGGRPRSRQGAAMGSRKVPEAQMAHYLSQSDARTQSQIR